MRIYHLIQTIFAALPAEPVGDSNTFNICYASSKEEALLFARRRLWRESVLSRFREETFFPNGMKRSSGPRLYASRTGNLRLFFEFLEWKLRELDTLGHCDLSDGSSMFLIEADTDTAVDDPDEIFAGQPLPVRREDLERDFYSVWTDAQGIKNITICGYFFSRDGGEWSSVEAVGIRMSLAEFVQEYASRGTEYTEELLQAARQYQEDYSSFDEAVTAYKEYFGGHPADACIPYGALTPTFPDGNYTC